MRNSLKNTYFTACLAARLLTLAAMGLYATQASAATLAVVVSGVKNDNGKVAVALFSGADGFPKNDSRAVQRIMLPIDGTSHSAKGVFTDLAPGDYAIATFHDDNSSGKLETNFFGIPTKGYGFSNNPRPKMRAANYDEARFELPPGGVSVNIDLAY